MNRSDKLTMLIVDDQIEVLEVYEEVLGHELGHQVDCVCSPGEAMHHVKKQLFDIVIIDAKNTYKGAAFGGLNLAEEVSSILGLGSVLLMSQFDVRDEVKNFNASYAFLPKPRESTNFLNWVKRDLMGRIGSMVSKQYGFVIMPFGEAESNEWYRTRLAPWMMEAGFDIKRMDEMGAGRRPINDVLLERIHESHFVVVYITRSNANVFFEAGFTYALGKYMIILAPRVDTLPFDVRLNQAFSYEGKDEKTLHDELVQFMASMRGMRT